MSDVIEADLAQFGLMMGKDLRVGEEDCEG